MFPPPFNLPFICIPLHRRIQNQTCHQVNNDSLKPAPLVHGYVLRVYLPSHFEGRQTKEGTFSYNMKPRFPYLLVEKLGYLTKYAPLATSV